MQLSQNIPLSLRIYPFFNKCICATLPEYTPPSLPEYTPFSRTKCDLPRIYPSLPESTPLSTKIILCDAPRIYPFLPEYTPPPLFQQLYMTLPESTTPSQNMPPFSTTRSLCDAPRVYPSLHPSKNILPPPPMQHSQKSPLPPRIPPVFRQLYAPFPLRIYPSSPFNNYMRYSKNIPFSH